MSVLEIATDLYLLIAALGLAASVQYAGLPMLGQGAFVAVGGFGTLLLADHGVPLLAAVALAVLIAAVAGYLLGAGAARLYGASLALATWVLAWLAYTALLAFPNEFGGAAGLVRDTPAELVSPSLGLSLRLTPTLHLVVAAVVVVLVLAGLHRFGGGPAGGDLAAVRESPALAASLGVRVGVRRRQVLATTAALGAFGGAGGAVLLGTVAPADVTPLLSLELLVAVLLAGSWRPWGVVVGFAVVAALPDVSDAVASALDRSAEHTRGALTSLLLVAVLVVRSPMRRWWSTQRWIRPRGREIGIQSYDTVPLRHRPEILRAVGLRVAFGGVRALDAADLEICPGEVHALIGPNGSGKSTLLRVLAGALPAAGGEVCLGNERLVGGQADRVRQGIVRTTQRTLLPAGLSPFAQTAIGAGATLAMPGAGIRHLFATPGGRRAALVPISHAFTALRVTGLLKSETSLDGGDQRMLQLARAVATGAGVLLLDEPAAGLAPAERESLARTVRTLAGNGLAVCVVEHDMRFVAAVADRVTVLDHGRVIARGTPGEIRRDPTVRAVYLGTGPDDVSAA